MLSWVFLGTASLFFVWAVTTLWHVRWIRRLPSLKEPANSRSNRPRCSVVMAARDEEDRIEQTVRRLLAQEVVDAEFILVDDRSSDRTAEILQRLAGEDSRIRLKRIESLPEGWLGKCHACHVGAGLAQAGWILFTDADCWLKPDVLARALVVAEQEKVDHVTLTSGLNGTAALKASHLLFLISLANWFSGVNRDRPGSYMGIGAFNLVRAEAYRQSGGYEALRLTVVDDMKLGLLLRRAGKRTRAFIGSDDAECHWGRTIWNIIKIMEKNYFAAVDYRLALVLAGSLFVLLLFGILLLGALSGTVEGWLAVAAPFLIAWPGGVLARRTGWAWAYALLIPFMFPLFLWAVLNSTCVTLRQGGVRWRETFYPLEMLRKGNVS